MAKKRKSTGTGYAKGDTITIRKPARYTALRNEAAGIIAGLAAKQLASELCFGFSIYDAPTLDTFLALGSKKKKREFIISVCKELADTREKFQKENHERCNLQRQNEILQQGISSRNAAIKSLSEVL